MERCKWIVGVGCVVASLLGTQAGGQTPPAAAATPAQDYSQGFRAFIRLGLPDTSKATYVELDYDGPHMLGRGSYSLHEIQLQGDAWLLAENTSATSTLLTASGVVLELVDTQTHRKRLAAEARSNAVARAAGGLAGRSYVPTGSWKPRDLGRDLDKASAFVAKKIQAKAAGGREFRYDSFLRSDDGPGSLFLLAVLAWQNGRTEEANALAGSLFELVGDSRKVIVGAMNVMANAQLAATASTFRATRDWNAYQAAVAALLQKYPAGWRQAAMARLLLERLQARAALATPPPVGGEGLDDEDRALAAALAMDPAQGVAYGGAIALWFLPGAWPTRSGEEAGVVGRIKARGVRSIPLLLALAADETLCPLFRDEVGMATYSGFWSEESGQSDEDRALAFYRKMDRPQTRGEIARQLLEPLCRKEESEQRRRSRDDERTPEEVVEAAGETYAAIRTLPPAELAGYFLKHGDERQKQAAIGSLLASGVETNAPLIEAFLLTPADDALGMMRGGYGDGLAGQYVRKRGEAAADFVERYAAMRQKIELPAGMESQESVVKQMKKMIDREIATLRAMVRKPDLPGTIAALVNVESEDDHHAMVAYQTLGRFPADSAVPALLGAAVGSTNVVVRSRILQMLPMLRFAGMQEDLEPDDLASGEDMEAAMEALAARNRLSIGTNAAAWKSLLADTRPAVAMWGGFGEANEPTLADLTASAIESLYAAKSPMERYGRRSGAVNLPTEVAMRVMRARAEARLAGTPEAQLPQLPSADDVADERRAAIVAAVTQAASGDLPALLDGLSASENLYLVLVADENAAIKKALAAPSRRIVSVQLDAALPDEAAARLKKLEGTVVTTNAIAAMRDCCLQQLAGGATYSVGLASAGFGRGLALTVKPIDGAGRRGMGYASYLDQLNRKTAKARGMVMGMLQGGEERYGHGVWLVELAQEAVPAVAPVVAGGGDAVAGGEAGGNEDEDEDEDDDDDEAMVEMMVSAFAEQQESFAEAAQAFCGGDEPLGGDATVSFTGMLPSKKGDKDADDDDDDDDFEMYL